MYNLSSINLSIYLVLSIFLPISYLPSFLSSFLPVFYYLSIHLSISLSSFFSFLCLLLSIIYLSPTICLYFSIFLLSIHLFVMYLSVFYFLCLCIYLPIYQLSVFSSHITCPLGSVTLEIPDYIRVTSHNKHETGESQGLGKGQLSLITLRK